MSYNSRYAKGLTNFFGAYVDLVDNWYLYDNSEGKPQKIAWSNQGRPVIYDRKVFESIRRIYGQH